MICNITATPEFRAKMKKLAKRYKSIKDDFANFIMYLQSNPLQGVDLGGGKRKIRIAISSKGKGKSGGARIITFNALVSIDEADVVLVTIYDKSDRENITNSEIETIMKNNGLE